MNAYLFYIQNNYFKHLLCTIFTIIIFRIIIRKYFTKNIKVNCWFCNEYIYVPKINENAFTCPCCYQYNGFQEDGDYNIRIPSQLYEELNPKSFVCKKQNNDDTRMICNVCIDNETKKIELLNRFVPMDSICYYQEYDEYKRELEKLFPLCYVCEIRVRDRLNEINNEVLPNYIKWSSIKNKKNNVPQYRRSSLLKHLNVVPITVIMISLIAIFMFQIGPHMDFKNNIFIIKTELKIFIDFFLFTVIFTVNKFCNLRPSIKFKSSRLLLLIVIIGTSFILGKSNDYVPVFFQKVLSVPIKLWTVLIILDFSIRIFRLIKSCSFKKHLISQSDNEFKSMPINGYQMKNNMDKFDTYSEYCNTKKNNHMNPFQLSKESPQSLYRDKLVCNDTNSFHSLKFQSSVNPIRRSRFDNDRYSMTQSNNDTRSVFSFKSNYTNNPFRLPEQNVIGMSPAIFGGSQTTQNYANPFINCPSLFNGDTRSVSSYHSSKTLKKSRVNSPMDCDGTLSNSSQSYNTPTQAIRQANTKSYSSSVVSHGSQRSRTSTRVQEKKLTFRKIGRTLFLGILIGCLLNLALMLVVSYCEPHIDKYF